MKTVKAAHYLQWINAVECCYNAVQYIMILHTSLQKVRQNIIQRLNPQHYIPRPDGRDMRFFREYD